MLAAGLLGWGLGARPHASLSASETAASPLADQLDSLAAVQVLAINPTTVCPGDELTISGREFGRLRTEAGGKILIAGAEVRDYLQWREREIVVLVPRGAEVGDNRRLYVITSGGYQRASVNVSDGGAC